MNEAYQLWLLNGQQPLPDVVVVLLLLEFLIMAWLVYKL